MCALDMGGVGAPASGFEGGRVDEALVDGQEAFAHTVGDFIEVTRAQLIRDQPSQEISYSIVLEVYIESNLLFQLNDRHDVACALDASQC